MQKLSRPRFHNQADAEFHKKNGQEAQKLIAQLSEKKSLHAMSLSCARDKRILRVHDHERERCQKVDSLLRVTPTQQEGRHKRPRAGGSASDS